MLTPPPSLPNLHTQVRSGQFWTQDDILEHTIETDFPHEYTVLVTEHSYEAKTHLFDFVRNDFDITFPAHHADPSTLRRITCHNLLTNTLAVCGNHPLCCRT